MTCPNLEHYADFLRGEEKSNTLSYSNADSDGSSSGLFSDDSEDDFHPSAVTASSSSDTEKDTVRINRKRCRCNSQNENQKQQKKLRNSGRAYVSLGALKKNIKEKSLQPPCGIKCRLQCSNKILESSRHQIFNKYWSTGDLQRQREFIASHTNHIKPKYRYSSTQDLRGLNIAYFFNINSKCIRVCKKFFKATLNIGDKAISTAVKKRNENGFTETDLRGRHNNHPKVSHEIKNSVRQFIINIPKIESHYLRAKTTREYIESGKSIGDVYKDYKEHRISENLVPASRIMFYRIFKEEFNISFFKPKKDLCDLCESFLNADDNEKKVLNKAYTIHQEEKELCRKEKNLDKNRCYTAVYDLQAVLQLPKGFSSSFYYKSKINCFNFTISDLKAKNVDCFFWTEVEGKRGSNEIGTCVLMYIKNLAEKSDNASELDLIFYSDNCCGQQKNKYLLSMYFYAIHKYNLRSITHKYLIQGHTQNEGDNVHSVIEKQVKRHLGSKPIYTPDQYTTLIATAKKTGVPYRVHELSHDAFYDMKSLQEEWGHNFILNEANQKVNWRNIKVLRVENGNTDSFLYKTSYKDTDFIKVCVDKNNLKPTTYWNSHK